MLLILLLFWLSYSDVELASSFQPTSSTLVSDERTQEIFGRDNSQLPLYQVKVPKKWKNQIQSALSLEDTTKPLCEFIIQNNEHDSDTEKSMGQIRITIHNFPSESITERIPPNAQIARWKRQLTKMDPNSLSVEPQAFGGFVGFLFEGTGLLSEDPTTILGWIMQIAPEHYRALNRPGKDVNYRKQMRADYTLKAVGPKQLIEKYKDEIIVFARSFELIQEIPSQP